MASSSDVGNVSGKGLRLSGQRGPGRSATEDWSLNPGSADLFTLLFFRNMEAMIFTGELNTTSTSMASGHCCLIISPAAPPTW